MAGGDLFDGQFMEEQIAYYYKTQDRLSNLLGLLSFIAIVISSMGMLAMSIYFTRQRARDMAVRKVFGATPHGVLGLLMGGFTQVGRRCVRNIGSYNLSANAGVVERVCLSHQAHTRSVPYSRRHSARDSGAYRGGTLCEGGGI